jgi:hypothetical protein
MPWSTRDKDRAERIFIGVITAAVSLFGAYWSSGKAFDDRLESAGRELATAKRDLDELTQRIDGSFRLLATCKMEDKTVIAEGPERPLVFAECGAGDEGASSHTGRWIFTAPTPGLYQIAAVLRFEGAEDGYIALNLRTPQGKRVLAGGVTPGKPAYAPTVAGSAVINLNQGEQLWLTVDQLNESHQSRRLTHMSWVQVTRLLAPSTPRGA